MIEQLPISTQWTMDAAGETGRSLIPNILMIYTEDTNSKGSGFLLENGFVVTNAHVVAKANIKNIVGKFSDNREIRFKSFIIDQGLDLIILVPIHKIEGGLQLSNNSNLSIGEMVCTWGYPLGYSGPSPLFSAGFVRRQLSCPVDDNYLGRFITL